MLEPLLTYGGVAAVIALGFALAMALRPPSPVTLPLDLHDLPSLDGVLSYRAVQPADVNRLLEMSADPIAMAANGWDDATIAKRRKDVATSRGFKAFAATRFVAFETATGEIVGLGGATLPAPRKPGAPQIGFEIHPDYRGRGYGTALMAAAITTFRRATPGDVLVGTSTTNTAVTRIMDRLGFTPAATLPFDAPNGDVFDAHWYHVGRAAQASTDPH